MRHLENGKERKESVVARREEWSEKDKDKGEGEGGKGWLWSTFSTTARLPTLLPVSHRVRSLSPHLLFIIIIMSKLK